MKEIGSEFWWDGELYEYRNTNILSIFSDYSSLVLTTTGRGAIQYLIDELGLANKKVLLPSYICESVILPFEKANCDIEYYDLNLDLSPKFDHKLNILNYDVLLHLGYFGFETNSKLNQFLKNNKEDIIIIEDVTHSLFTQKSKESDYYIGSIRKWIGIPSGGFVASETELNEDIEFRQKEFVDIRLEALVEKAEHIKIKKSNKNFLEKFEAAESIIDEDTSAYKIDDLSMSIVRKYDYDQLVSIRRENFLYLLNNIEEADDVKIVFDRLEDDVCPMFFPIYVENRDDLREYLIDSEIYCPVHWPIPEQVKNKITDNAKWIYEHILSIPCDQRYGKKDMQRIIETINKWRNSRSC